MTKQLDDVSIDNSADDMLLSLEKQIDNIIQQLNQLKQENAMLRSQQELLEKEKSALFDQNHQVKNKIEALIMHLRSLE